MYYLYGVDLIFYDNLNGGVTQNIKTMLIAHDQEEAKNLIKSQYTGEDYKIIKIDAIREI